MITSVTAIPRCVLLVLWMLLLAGSARADPMDSLAVDKYDIYEKQAASITDLIEQGESTAAVALCRDVLKDLGRIKRLPTMASAEQKTDFATQCELTYYFADAAFYVIYHEDDYKDALPFGEQAIKAATMLMESRAPSDYIKTSWVLEDFDAIRFAYAEIEQTEKAIGACDRGIAYAKARGLAELNPEAKWHLGRLHASLAYYLWDLPLLNFRRYSSKSVYKTGVAYLIAGAASQLEDPEELHEYLPDALSAALSYTSDDYQMYKKLLVNYTTRLESHNHPALDTSLAALYLNRAFWEYDYGTLQDAILWNKKTIDKVGFDFEETTYSLYALYTQASYHIMAGDVVAAETQLAQLKDLAQKLDEPADVLAVRGWIAATEADLHFLAMDAGRMTRALAKILDESALNPTNQDHAWLLVHALINNTPFEDDLKKAAAMLHRLGDIIEQAEKNEEMAADIPVLRQYYELVKMDVYDLPWFDETFTDSIILPAPGNLREVKLNDLFIMHEFEYRKGDRGACERVSTEILRRGVSMQYLTALFWMYNGGK